MKILFVYLAVLVCAHQLQTTVMALSVGIQLPEQSRAPSAPGSTVAAAAATRGGDVAAKNAATADAQDQAARETAAANAAAKAAQEYAQSKASGPPSEPPAPVSRPGSGNGAGKRSSEWTTEPTLSSGSTSPSYGSSDLKRDLVGQSSGAVASPGSRGNWARRMLMKNGKGASGAL